MRLPRFDPALPRAALVAFVTAISACVGPGSPPVSGGPLSQSLAGANVRGHAAGLGPVLPSKFGGAIFGWDMNQNGNDGFLAEFASGPHGNFFATETFDEAAVRIVKVVRKEPSPGGNDEPFPQAIMGNDVGFIDVERVIVKGNNLHRDDRFALMNPVSGNKITGMSKPSQVYGIVPSFVTNNQSSSTQAMMAIRYGRPGAKTHANLYLYDSATNAWLPPYVFGPREIFAGYALYAAVDAPSNEVFVGYQAGEGSFNYLPPRFNVFDGSSGKLLRSFKGLGHGFLNGMAIDSTTGIMCTTTFGDMDVEFYKVSTGKGFAVTIPGQGGPLTQGAGVAVDQVNHLFLVAQLNSTFSPSGGSTVIVYDENGNLIEAINGFSFLNNSSPLVPHIAVNGATRMGYAPGSGPKGTPGTYLQSFSY